MIQKITLAMAASIMIALGTGTAHAANCNDATVTYVLASSTSCQDGSFAYQTSAATNWICVATSGMNASRLEALNDLVLSAYLSGKTVNYSMSTSGCNPSTNWTSSTTLFYLVP